MISLSAKLLRAGLASGLGVSLAGLALAASTTRAATITVNTTADDTTVNGNCTLREALIAANTDTAMDACPAGSGADTILLPAGHYVLTIAGPGESAGFTGDLDINADVTLQGAGRNNTTIDGNGLDRVIDITGAAATISGVTITGGDSGFSAGSGVSVFVNAALTLTHSRVTGNSASGGVYVVHSARGLTMMDSRIDHNVGAGVDISGAGVPASIVESVIDDNSLDGDGAGLRNDGVLEVVNTTISGNRATNSAGGVLSSGSTNLYNVTVANNTADSDSTGFGSGGGVLVLTGTLSARNSLIGANFDNGSIQTSPDCWGNITSAGHNLIQDTRQCVLTGTLTGNVTGVGPKLGPLQGNGGGTLTQALLAGSPAIDGGDPSGCVDPLNHPLSTDQRGFVRNGLCDIGAYEFDSPGLATPTATATPTPTPTATCVPGPDLGCFAPPPPMYLPVIQL